MDSFLRQGQRNMLKSVWEEIQVVPLDTPGLFRLWVSIDGNIQQLKVRFAWVSFATFIVSWYWQGYCISKIFRVLGAYQPDHLLCNLSYAKFSPIFTKLDLFRLQLNANNLLTCTLLIRVTEPFDEYSKIDIRYSMVRSIEYLLVQKCSIFDEVRYSMVRSIEYLKDSKRFDFRWV